MDVTPTNPAAAPPTFGNFIDGAWVPSETGAVFESRNPADDREVIGVFQRSSPDDAAAAIAAAARAYESWRLVPAPARAEVLFRAAQLIAERKEAFARDMTREMGKVLGFSDDALNRYTSLFAGGDYPHTLKLQEQLKLAGIGGHPRLGKLVDLMEPFAKVRRKDDPLAGPWDELTSAQATMTADVEAFGEEAAAQTAAWEGAGR